MTHKVEFTCDKAKELLEIVTKKDKCISKAINIISDKIYYNCTKGKNYMSFDTRYGQFQNETGCPVEYLPEVFRYFIDAGYTVLIDRQKISWA